MARTIIRGIPVSAGVSIGKAFFLNRNRYERLPRRIISPRRIAKELERLNKAFAATATQLEEIRANVPAELQEHGLIIDSHIMIVRDPKLSKTAAEILEKNGINAEWALEKAVVELGRVFEALDDPYFRERLGDIRIVAGRIMDQLLGGKKDLQALEGRVVLMAHDLSPADTVELEVTRIMSLVTTLGAKTSHTGILARSLQIPAVVGVSDLEEKVSDGDLVVVDGLKGKILVDPNEDELAQYEELSSQFNDYQKSIIRFCHLPGETRDGHSLRILSNIELFEEVAQVLDNGGEGVGLLRTEYKYMNRRDLPTETELYEEYSELASILNPRPLTIRTLDLGADKMISSFGALEENNPTLGLRAIRFCMRHPNIFKTQLRAILRAATQGNVRVMFPMISGLKELRYAKNMLSECRRELAMEGLAFNPDLPTGIMVELPSAVMVSEFLAREVDFFSIGTNDLIQYTLGIDRTNNHVSYLYQPLHPAIVRSIKHAVDAAHKAGIEISLCGEMAADPFCVPILIGMHIDCLSLNPQAIPGIKRIIRQTTTEECASLLKLVLTSSTVSRTNRLVKDIIYQRFPEELTFFSSLLEGDEGNGNAP